MAVCSDFSRICVSWFLLTVATVNTKEHQRPNIVLIIADDLGWNDVSFHGSDQVQTPNIDVLAYTGMTLHNYYTHCLCSPSRTATLTGKFAHKLGMQGYPILQSEDRGIPIGEKLLPQYLKELGYATHLVGKWHVGHSREEYLPTNRGFDSHFGHWGGFIDYYEYTAEENWTTGKVSGLDLHRNLTAAWDIEGYITDIYTDEAQKIIRSHDKSKPLFLELAHVAPHAANEAAILQAPADVVRSMRHVELPERRIFAAMVKKLDDSVGKVFETLAEENILNNTIIIFVADNGGMTTGDSVNFASNWPLRGLKMSPFEGGIRVVGLMWSDGMTASNHIYNGKIHSVDWLPTLVKAAGGDDISGIDGLDHWDSITNNKESPRKEFYEIDDYTGFASITSGKYKLVTGEPVESYSKYYGEPLRGIIGEPPSYVDALENSKVNAVLNKIGKTLDLEMVVKHRSKLEIDCGNNNNVKDCQPNKDKLCLYDIETDPCEKNDLSNDLSDVTQDLQNRLLQEWDKRSPRTIPYVRDPNSRPSLHNYTWTTWLEDTAS